MTPTRWLRLALLASVTTGCAPVVGSVLVGTDDTDPVADPCNSLGLKQVIDEQDLDGMGDRYLVCGDLDGPGDCPADPDAMRAFVYANLGAVSDPDFCSWSVGEDVCGPTPVRSTSCCYAVSLSILCEGRPLTTDDGPRTATSAAGITWLDDLEQLDPLPDDVRAAASAAWRRAALAEHASVASFARFALELLALGAPASLVDEATRAQADEVRHARQAFAVLSWLTGAPESPGPLPLDGVHPRTTPEQVLTATLLEGCVNETLAAAEAARAAQACSTPPLADRLAALAEDEARHAALAWRTVRWLLGANPELRPLARSVLVSALHDGPAARRTADLPDAAWHQAGLLPPEARAALRRQVLRDVVRPVGEAVIGPLDDTCAPRAEA